ncbi:MAG: hydrogenase maturation protease [Candidatus Thorarchaeota archaeon]
MSELVTDSVGKKASNQKSAVILGIGNTLRIDDGVGIVLVESLEQNLAGQPNIAFETMQTGGIDILGSIEGFDLAIIIDAAFMNANPGEARWLPVGKSDRNIRLYSSTHSAGVLETIQMARTIQNLDMPEIIVVLGIQVKETKGFGENLTEEVAVGAKTAFQMIIEKLKEFKILDKDLDVASPEFS